MSGAAGLAVTAVGPTATGASVPGGDGSLLNPLATRKHSSLTPKGSIGGISITKSDPRQNLFRIPDNIDVGLGLRWEFIGDDPVDLDASCVAFDESGLFQDCVFFNHLRAEENGYMEHSGDNQTGEGADGDDDETIVFHMNLIPKEVCYLMVCVTSYTGIDFTLVSKAKCRLLNLATKETVGSFSLGIVGRHTATLLCAISRVLPGEGSLQVGATSSNGNAISTGIPPTQSWWEMREINIPSLGYTFCDVLPKMLDLLAVPEDQRDARLANIPDYSLAKDNDKGDVVLSQLRLGLGWDGENDLDAALIMLDTEGKYIDHVHAKYGKLSSNDKAVQHSGDKLNGYDVAGDDEFIDVDLNSIDRRIDKIYFLALLYDGFHKTLSAVPHCYARVQNKSSPLEHAFREIDRYSLSKLAEDATAMVLFLFRRKDVSHWEMIQVGQRTHGKDWIDVYPFVRSMAKHFSTSLVDWEQWRSGAEVSFAVQLTFLEARSLSPLEPHHFCAHCEAWICDHKLRERATTPFCYDRENTRWENAKATFVVTQMDVIRVMLFEHAMVGCADLDMSVLVEPLASPGAVVEQWFPLQGFRISGELKLRLERAEMPKPTSQGLLSYCSIM